MKSKELDLEYEFDMDDLQVYCMVAVSFWFFAIVMIYVTWDYFNTGFGIPFMLVLVFYVLIDEHNDQIKERNDVRIAESLKANDYIQQVHKTAIKYV